MREAVEAIFLLGAAVCCGIEAHSILAGVSVYAGLGYLGMKIEDMK